MLGHFLLHYLFTSEVEKSTAYVIHFKCPACEAANVTGEVFDHSERFKLLNFIPLGTARSTWVVCNACHLKSRSELPTGELVRQAPGEINRFIRRRLPPGLILLAVAGVPFCLFPPFGFICPAVVLAWGGKYGGWIRRLARIQIGIGCVMVVILIVAIPLALIFEKPAPKPTFAPIRKSAPAAAPAPGTGAKP